MKDLALYETGNGGDIFKTSTDDLASVEMLVQQVFFCLFGGNVEASTRGNETESEKRLDWWANSLLFGATTEKQFNSSTEKTLNSVVLNSAGRAEIQRSVENDLQYLKKIVSLRVEVSIPSHNRVDIRIYLKELKNKESKILQFLWDSAKKEIITEKPL